MLIAFLSSLLSGNFEFLYSLIANNLHYFFAFSAFMYALTNGKKFIKATFILTIYIWAMLDFISISGWAGFVAGFMFLNYAGKISVFAILSENPKLDKKAILISEIVAYAIWSYYNLIIVGVTP